VEALYPTSSSAFAVNATLIAIARRKRERNLAASKAVADLEEPLNPTSRDGYESFNSQAPVSTEDTSQDPITCAMPNFGYQKDWTQYQQRYQEVWLHNSLTSDVIAPTPWLLQNSAMQDRGLDMSLLDANMEWEGMNDLMQEFNSELSTNNAASGWRWDLSWLGFGWDYPILMCERI